MKTNKKYYRLFAIGLLVLNHDFILFKRFFIVTDFWSDLLKGIGIGIILSSAFLILKHNRKHKLNCISK